MQYNKDGNSIRIWWWEFYQPANYYFPFSLSFVKFYDCIGQDEGRIRNSSCFSYRTTLALKSVADIESPADTDTDVDVAFPFR